MNNYNTAICIVGICLVITALVIFINHLRTKKTIDRIENMLNEAAKGNFSEKSFDETRLSSLESRFAHYLSASVVSARNVELEKDKIKSLIADISHQTKTPIANLLLYSELLLEDDTDNLSVQMRENIVQLHAQSEKLQFLIASLVKLSRLENGILQLSPQEEALKSMLTLAVKETEFKARAKGLELILHDTDEKAYFDSKWTLEAICNILDNALKYTNEGTISLSVTAYEMFVRIDIKDSGNGLQDIMNCEMNPIPQLEKKQMPTKIAELNWKTETDEIKLKKCVVAPITYMEQYKEEISSAAIHVEWKKKYLKNEEKTIQKIETYLYNSHDQSFRYRIYSPEIELRNNTIKVMTSLQAINKVALLFMAVFLTGMIAIYQLRFEHREESYGISLAYGAQYKELYWEIFCEILLLNSIGTIIGIVIGYLVTYYVDFGIMISVVNVQGSWYTFLSAYGLCVVLSSFVWIKNYASKLA